MCVEMLAGNVGPRASAVLLIEVLRISPFAGCGVNCNLQCLCMLHVFGSAWLCED